MWHQRKRGKIGKIFSPHSAVQTAFPRSRNPVARMFPHLCLLHLRSLNWWATDAITVAMNKYAQGYNIPLTGHCWSSSTFRDSGGCWPAVSIYLLQWGSNLLWQPVTIQDLPLTFRHLDVSLKRRRNELQDQERSHGRTFYLCKSCQPLSSTARHKVIYTSNVVA